MTTITMSSPTARSWAASSTPPRRQWEHRGCGRSPSATTRIALRRTATSDARGRDGGVREKLVAGVGMVEIARVRTTEAERRRFSQRMRGQLSFWRIDHADVAVALASTWDQPNGTNLITERVVTT